MVTALLLVSVEARAEDDLFGQLSVREVLICTGFIYTSATTVQRCRAYLQSPFGDVLWC